MQLYDLDTKQWSRELCAVYGVDPALLPPLVNAGECLGPILPELREALGMVEDAVFIVGGADTQSALLQTGIRPGDIAVVAGTTAPVTALTDRKLTDPQQRVWVDANFGAKGYLLEMNPGVTGLNYQRARDFLAPDTPYEELERIYAEKRDFRCTASFSSLLFYERRSLRNAGFFLPGPFPEPLDKVDMLWAVLADSACAIYEQLWRLRDLSGHDRPYILACGGGFRSAALCHMLADLSGLELRLKPGFEQATVFGLVALCNGALHDDTVLGADGEERVYKPTENPLIRRYHRQWNARRLALNPA
jgi:autoinducer 2 (AI-2) kinase